MSEARLGGDPTPFASRALEIDADRRVLASDAPDVAVGSELTTASMLGEAMLSVIAAASSSKGEAARLVHDHTRGTQWLVRARVSLDPWCARVDAVDVTPAIGAERDAILGRLAHSMQNVSFAIQAVVEAIEQDRPVGAELEVYLGHLREPAQRLSSTMTRLTRFLSPPVLALEPLRMDVLVARALDRVAGGSRPARLAVRGEPLTVRGDVEQLADTVAAMLESGGEGRATALEMAADTAVGPASVRVVVERRATEREAARGDALWDLAHGDELESSLRLSAARAVVVAHGGAVFCEEAPRGLVRLGIRLPLVSAR